MAFYVDTSAFLKLVVRERDSAAARRFLLGHDGSLVASDLLRTEALRAAKRHSLPAVRRARELLEAFTILRLSTDACERAAELDPSILRSLDALHLASALTLGDGLDAVVTYDERLADACALHGIEAVAPRGRG